MEKKSSSKVMEKQGKVPCVINGVDLTSSLPTPLWVTFTEDQKKQIQEFKKIPEVEAHTRPEHTDYYFSRFLVARKWDVKASTELFVNAMKLRETENVDSILETFPHEFWYKTIIEYWPTSISPTNPLCAKDGCPVMYERIGLVNPKLADLIPMDVLLRHHLYTVELMERANRKVVDNNGFSAGTILIENLEDLGASHLYGKVVKLVSGIAARDEVSNPEAVRKIYIVNPPGIFSVVWSIMKPFIEERTQAKFAFGTTKEFKEEWEKIIGLENLPKSLGGSASWELPTAGNSIKGLIPTQMSNIDIPRRGSHIFEIAVKSGQNLNVEFLVKSGKDIGFALFIKTGTDIKSKNDRKEVDEYKMKKIDEELTPFHCRVEVKEDTTFIAYFDNTDSPMLGRDLAILTYVQDSPKL